MGGMMQAASAPWLNLQQFKMQERLMEDQQDYAQDMFDYQMGSLMDMFPLTGAVQDLGMRLYTGDGANEIEDYLMNPTKPTNLQRQLFEFFGGQEPSKQRGTGGRFLNKYGAKQSGPLAGMGVPMLEETLGRLEGLIPTGQELAETGFRTDIGPAQDYALRLLNREMVPELAERFGSNITGSGFQNALMGASGDVASELGAMQVALDEAAAGRRLQGLQSGTVQGLFTGPLDEATQFALMGGQVGQNYREMLDMARPGRGLLGAMPAFVQGATSGGFIQPGFPTSGTDAGNLFSALGQTGSSTLGGLGGLLSDWISGRGQGGGDAGISMGSGSLPTGSLVGGGDWGTSGGLFSNTSPGGVETGSLVGGTPTATPGLGSIWQ